MTDTPALPENEALVTEPELPPPSPPPEPHAGRNLVPWFYALGFLILAGAIAYLWVNTQGLTVPGTSPNNQQAIEQQLQGIGQQLHDMDARLTRLEQRPVPPDLSARVAALEQRPTGADTSALAARVAGLEQRVNAASQLAGRYDALAGRVDALGGKAESDDANLAHRIDALETRVNGVVSSAQQVTALNDRANRMARIEAATGALSAGRKLGDLPDAPPALSRYATADPPTEAGLRLAFPAVEHAAMAASQPQTAGKPFLDRAWARAQTLVTVRQGDDVVVGDAASGALARAHTALEAGDLAGAVNILSELKGPAAGAVAGWLDQAKGLLAARAALTDMAEHT
jgi:hypothetical protein